jgi:hypothetical protein
MKRAKTEKTEAQESMGRKGTYTFTTRIFPETYRALKQIRANFDIPDDTNLMEMLTLTTIQHINFMHKLKEAEEKAKVSAESAEEEIDSVLTEEMFNEENITRTTKEEREKEALDEEV